MKLKTRRRLPRIAVATALVASATLASVLSAGVSAVGASSKATISVAYAADTTFDTIPLGAKWWGAVQKEFEAKYPNVTLKLIPIAGGEPDFLTKLALLYHSASTSPDVTQFPSTEIALYESSGFLLPMDKYLKGSSWFSQYPPVIQNEGKIGAHIYAVSAGENNNGLFYDKAILAKAGIKVPWQPKTWADVITAAKAIKKAEPKVIPLWTDAGTSAGPNGAGYGILNLLAGSKTPTIQTSTGKMVVSSTGLLQTLNWYHEVFADGLGAPISDLFSENNAPNIPSTLFFKGQLGIAVGANFLGGNWTKMVSFPYWPQAGKGDRGGRAAQDQRRWLRVDAVGLGLRHLVAHEVRPGGGGAHQRDAGADQHGRGRELGGLGAAGEVLLVEPDVCELRGAVQPGLRRPAVLVDRAAGERQLLGLGAGDRGGIRHHRQDAEHHGRTSHGPDEELRHEPVGTERRRHAPVID